MGRLEDPRFPQRLAGRGMVVLCCLPWTVRNYRVLHAFVPLRSVLGLQLWVGNNPDAQVVWLGEQHPIHDSSEREQLCADGRDRIYEGEAG